MGLWAYTRRGQRCPGLELCRVGLHGLSDILDFLLAPELVIKRQVIANRGAHGFRDTNGARLGQTLQACGYIDTITIDLAPIDDDFTEIDADTKLDLAIIGQILIALLKILLDRYRTDEGVGHGGEISEHGITGEENTGAFMVIVSFGPDEGADKDIVIQIEDTVTDELLDPPRPWKFSPKTVSVRNGFATEVRYEPDIE